MHSVSIFQIIFISILLYLLFKIISIFHINKKKDIFFSIMKIIVDILFFTHRKSFKIKKITDSLTIDFE